jgi:hypothetical protein
VDTSHWKLLRKKLMKLWRVEEYRMQFSKAGFACHMEERRSEHPMIRAATPLRIGEKFQKLSSSNFRKTSNFSFLSCVCFRFRFRFGFRPSFTCICLIISYDAFHSQVFTTCPLRFWPPFFQQRTWCTSICTEYHLRKAYYSSPAMYPILFIN